jgi:hypothetical protein
MGAVQMAKRRQLVTLKPVEDEASVLLKRLEDGYEKIEVAQANGRDTAFLEEFWINLLHEYEAVCDELQKAA